MAVVTAIQKMVGVTIQQVVASFGNTLAPVMQNRSTGDILDHTGAILTISGGGASIPKALDVDTSQTDYWYIRYGTSISRVDITVYPTVTTTAQSIDWAGRYFLTYE